MRVAKSVRDRAAASYKDATARVIALPSFKELPECLFPLHTEAARREYDHVVRLLFDANRLTVGIHRTLSSYAAQFDGISMASATGKVISAPAFMNLDRSRQQLNIDGLDKRVAGPEAPQENKYALCGFAARRRRDLRAG